MRILHHKESLTSEDFYVDLFIRHMEISSGSYVHHITDHVCLDYRLGL
ncbi:MAG: hypothetical protein QW772_07970 [Zestosphaera sp.]